MDTNIQHFLEVPRKQKVLYIAGGIITVLMAVLICCNLLLIASNIREPNQMPSAFGIRPAIVLSGSMSPTFDAGDVILLKKTREPDKLEVGDVACYLYSGKATTHRIIERFEAEGKPRYVMKGDYNNVEDRLAVDPEQIQGVWTGGRIRHLGSFLMFLQSTMGMFVFLICPLAGLLAWDILKRRRLDRLRLERQGYGESPGYGYEEGQGAAGFGRIAKFRGILGRKPESGDRREEAGYRRNDRTEHGRISAGEPMDTRAVRVEPERQRLYAERSGTEAYPEYSEEGREEELTPSPRRRPPAPRREGPGEYDRPREPRESRETRNQTAAAGRMDIDRRGRTDQDDEFYYYSQLDDDLDYFEELEEAAEHYRKMKESLKRYRRMEAVMNRCRRLEEELSRYEALADRLETYERANLRGRQHGHAETGVSNQGTRRDPPG